MSSSNDTKLDNTVISSKDIKELEEGKDNKIDKTSTTTTSEPKKKSHSKGKSKKTSSNTASADKSLSHIDKVAPATLDNIQYNLSNPKIQSEIILNIADLVGQYKGSKLNKDELESLKNTVENTLIKKLLSK